MGVSVRMVRAAASTTPGALQSFEVAGFGTPKAAMFIITPALINDGAVSGAALAVGITDGVRQFCVAVSAQNATPPPGDSICNHLASNTSCIRMLAHDGTLDAVAVFSTWTANGVEIQWTDAPSGAFLVTVILFTGSDLTARVGDFPVSSTIGEASVNVVPGAPFPPDQLIVLGTRVTSYDATVGGGIMQIGFADRGAPIAQCSSNHFGITASAQSNNNNLVSNAFVSENSQSGGQAIEVTAFNSDGFTVTPRLSGSGVRYQYLALAYNGVAAHSVFVANSPTATGNQIRATAFKPQFVLQLPTAASKLSTAVLQDTCITSTTGAGSYGIAAFNATEIFSNFICDDDADPAMATRSYAIDKFVCRSDTNLNLHVATFVSFNPTNYTLNYTVANTTGRFWPTLVIGEATGGGPTTHNGLATLNITSSAVGVLTGISAGQATLQATSSAAGVSAVARPGTAQLNLASSVNGASSLILTAAQTLNIASSAAGVGNLIITSPAALSVSSTITAAGTVIHAALATLAVSSTLTPAPTVIRNGAAVLNVTSSLESAPAIIRNGLATLGSVFSIVSTAASNTQLGQATLNMTSTTNGDGQVVIVGLAALGITATVNGVGAVIYTGLAELAIISTVAPTPTLFRNGLATLPITSSVNGLGGVQLAALSTLSISSSFSGVGQVSHTGLSTLGITSGLSGIPAVGLFGQAALASVFALAATTGEVWESKGSPRLYLGADNAGLTFGMEVYWRSIGGEVKVRLLNETDTLVVGGSEMAITQTTFLRSRTGSLPLINNKLYRVQFARAVGAAGEVLSAGPVIL